MSPIRTNKIDDQAAAWVARLDRSDLSPEDRQAFDAWIAADIRHFGAYARARAISERFDRARALGPTYDVAAYERGADPYLNRRRVLWLGSAAAAVIAFLGFEASRRPSNIFLRTARGRIHLEPLDDGSVVTLNTDTTVSVSFSPEQRDVSLLSGEALFDVAKEAKRPFVVTVGHVRVRAVGTSFAIRREAESSVQILVKEGVVEVVNVAAGRSPATQLASANTRVVAADDGVIKETQIDEEEVERGLSWKDGMLSFDGTPLRDAASEFARYSDYQIIFRDPELGARTVTGMFSAYNPAGFARAVAANLDLQADIEEDRAVLQYRSP